jgi:hypothetical protein
MIAIISLLFILVFSFLITRVASIALTHTGLSKESAKFQSRSAFTGVGFTTNESDKVVNHPVRRKILMLLMIVGNAGIVTGISSLVLGFINLGGETTIAFRIAVLVAGVVLLWTIANSRLVERWLANIISRLLKKTARLDIKDYSSLLHLAGEYKISELPIDENHWLIGRKIKNSGLRKEGVMVLAINKKDGSFAGAPHADDTIEENDSIIVYGRDPVLKKLEARDRGFEGNREHREIIREQRKLEEEEKKKETTEHNE